MLQNTIQAKLTKKGTGGTQSKKGPVSGARKTIRSVSAIWSKLSPRAQQGRFLGYTCSIYVECDVACRMQQRTPQMKPQSVLMYAAYQLLQGKLHEQLVNLTLHGVCLQGACGMVWLIHRAEAVTLVRPREEQVPR